MFTVQDISNEISNNHSLEIICRDLYDKWIELDLPGCTIDNHKNVLLEELSALLQAKLQSTKDDTEQQLKEHRVLKVRREIEDWWTKCRFSEQQRLAFAPYLSREFTDELLVVHQEQLLWLQRYHADNLSLFELVNQYMELYDRYLQLEADDKDPNRLFENRGGQLLKAERDRKAARKDLPKLEKKIASLTAEFERKYERPFTINGVGFEESLKLHAQKFKENIEAFKAPNNNVGGGRLGSGLKRKYSTRPVSPSSASKRPKQLESVRKTLHVANK